MPVGPRTRGADGVVAGSRSLAQACGPHARRSLTAASCPVSFLTNTASESKITRELSRAVCLGPVVRRRALHDLRSGEPGGGDHPDRVERSRGSSPPGSGQPVPDPNPASITSMSERRSTALGVLGRRSAGAASTIFSMPTRSTSPTVMIVVSRSRPPCTSGPGDCHPADADLHQVGRRCVLQVGGVEPGVVVQRSSRSVSWVSTWRSKWMMLMLAVDVGAMPRMVG